MTNLTPYIGSYLYISAPVITKRNATADIAILTGEHAGRELNNAVFTRSRLIAQLNEGMPSVARLDFDINGLVFVDDAPADVRTMALEWHNSFSMRKHCERVARHESSHYTPRLLDELFGNDGYSLYTSEVDASFLPAVPDMLPEFYSDSRLGFSFQKEDGLTSIYFSSPENQGWMNAFSAQGILITDSNKTPKRLTTITRDVFAATVRDYRKGQQPLAVAVVPIDFFSDYKLGDFVTIDGQQRPLERFEATMFLDGGNTFAWETIDEMIDESAAVIPESKDNPHDLGPITRRFRARAATGQFRLLCEVGQYKGDYVAATRAQMMQALIDHMPPGMTIYDYGTPAIDADGNEYFDLITIEDNLKGEVKWNNGTYCFVEPHGGSQGSDVQRDIKHAMTNQQSLAWLQNSLYHYKELDLGLKQYLSTIINKVKNGYIPKFFSDTSKDSDSFSSIDKYRSMALQFEKDGLGIANSIFLTRRVLQSVIQKIRKEQNNYKVPVRCSMYVHVATDSWLRSAGRPQEDWPNGEGFTERGYVWYDKQTHRMVYNDLDFVEDYILHGGWDLDDGFFAHARTLVEGEDRTRVFVNVRSPNTHGEYGIRKWSPGTFHPIWRYTDSNGKSHRIEFPELDASTLPQNVKELSNISYQYNSLASSDLRSDVLSNGDRSPIVKDIYNEYPQLDGYKPINGPYTKDSVAARMVTSGVFYGLFGRYVNTYMVWHDMTGEHRTSQLAPLEEVVDSSTQDQSIEAAQLILDAVNQLRVDINIRTHTEDDVYVDRDLWKRRGGGLIPKTTYEGVSLPRTPRSRAGLITQLNERSRLRVNAACDTVEEHVQGVIRNIPMNIIKEITPRDWVQRGHEMVGKIMSVMASYEDATTEDYDELNDAFVSRLEAYSVHNRNLLLLGMMHACYSKPRGSKYTDTALFMSSSNVMDRNVLDYYIDALQYFGLDSYMRNGSQGWNKSILCRCGEEHIFTDIVEHAKALANTVVEATHMIHVNLTYDKHSITTRVDSGVELPGSRQRFVDAYQTAMDDIERVVDIIESADTTSAAVELLMEHYDWSPLQARAVYDRAEIENAIVLDTCPGKD